MTPSLISLLLVVILLGGGCATPVSQTDRASIKTVAVVSDLTPEIKFHTMGVLPVIQKERTSQTKSFSVSGTAEAVVVQALTAKGYTVKPMSEELKAVAKQLIEDRFSESKLTSLSLLQKTSMRLYSSSHSVIKDFTAVRQDSAELRLSHQRFSG